MKKKVIIAGGSGLIGKRIIELIDKDKYEIGILSRNPKPNAAIKSYKWDLDRGYIQDEVFENLHAIINLAGAGIADKRWTNDRKKIIVESRTKGNELFKKHLNDKGLTLAVYISASAVGFYGHRKDEVLTEASIQGPSSFLVNTTVTWEKAIQELKPCVERLVTIRVGLVLSSQGGALKELLLPAKFGSIGYFGNGEHYFPWIHIDDISMVFIEALKNQSWKGIYNGVNPIPLTGKEFAEAFKSAKSGFQIIHPIPKFSLKMVLGEMVEMLFSSMRVIPERLTEVSFPFKFKNASEAIKDILKKDL